ncbi:hypothetical protein LguiB_019176 [Lonicera macranthoides]
MASSPETTPTNKTSPNSPSNESSKDSSEKSKNASPPSSSPSTHPSPPPKSPPPPPPLDSPLASPPQSSPPKSLLPPPKESPSSPPPQSPPQQSKSPPSPSPPPPPPPSHSTTPSPPPPSATTTTPPNSTATPLGVFAPPPPLGASLLSPPSTSPRNESSPTSREKSPSYNNSGSKSSPADTSSTANIAIIAGITGASVLLLALVILIAACMLKKKRKPYYHGPPKGDPYYTSPTPWHSPQGHIVHIAPPPGVMGTPIGGGGGWAAQPHIGADGVWAAAQPHTSSEFSSGYSGNGPAQTPVQAQSPNVGLGLSKSQFTYEELAGATGGFSQGNLLGQGGFGYVHKGVLPNGQTVAVKSLKTGSGQGEREFQAEVEIISRVHHRHLVSLVGYCIADGQRMLVYEFVPNKTMEFHLHGKGRPVMDWATRLRIALGSAKGLAYLHEDCHPKIIHRDIKAANILLDDKFEAMVADFGLAKLSADNNTHVSTRVMGTFGYLAPEYASSGKLTEKSDVFSFGVMLLELITGRKPVDPNHNFMEDSLVDWARPLISKAIDDGNYKALVDPRLEDNFAIDEMARMVACASACIRHSARRRPKMTQIARALDGDSSLDDLEGGKAWQGTSSSGSSQSYDTGAYNADMMKFRQMVMSSQEFLSSEYGGGTDEYYAPPSTSSDSRDADIHSGAERQKM